MDIRKSNMRKLLKERKISKKDIQLLEKIIDDLTEHFNSKNALIRKYKIGKEMFDDMDKHSQRELQLIFNENARPKGAHERTYNKPSETEVTDYELIF